MKCTGRNTERRWGEHRFRYPIEEVARGPALDAEVLGLVEVPVVWGLVDGGAGGDVDFHAVGR